MVVGHPEGGCGVGDSGDPPSVGPQQPGQERTHVGVVLDQEDVSRLGQRLLRLRGRFAVRGPDPSLGLGPERGRHAGADVHRPGRGHGRPHGQPDAERAADADGAVEGNRPRCAVARSATSDSPIPAPSRLRARVPGAW